MIDTTTSVVPVDGVDLVLEQVGAGGRPILLVHGFCGERLDFEPLFGPLAGHGWHAAAPDNRGHGDSGKPDDEAAYTVDRFAADALAVADSLGWSQFVLLGHSLGGVIAQRIVTMAPERVQGLILMSTTYTRLHIDPGTLAAGAHLARTRGLSELAELLRDLDDPVGASSAHERTCARIPGYRERGERNMLRCSPAMYAAVLDLFAAGVDRSDEVRGIGCPTLVIVGDEDELMLDAGTRLAELIPGARFVVTPAAGHSPQFDHPEAFTSAVLAFLDGLAQRVSTPPGPSTAG